MSNHHHHHKLLLCPNFSSYLLSLLLLLLFYLLIDNVKEKENFQESRTSRSRVLLLWMMDWLILIVPSYIQGKQYWLTVVVVRVKLTSLYVMTFWIIITNIIGIEKVVNFIPNVILSSRLSHDLFFIKKNKIKMMIIEIIRT